MQKLILLLLLLTFSACCSKKNIAIENKNSDLGLDTYKHKEMEFFRCLSGVSPKMKSKLDELGVKRVVLVGGHFIEDDSDFTVNEDNIISYLDKVVPGNDTEAMIVLDFEGQKMNSLNKTKDEKEVDKIVSHYIDVLKFFKSQRPNAMIGYYGFPFRDYWNRNEKWRQNNNKLIPLFEEVDALFPSIYDFYVDNVNVKRSKDDAYIRDNVIEAIRLAKGKPVYPFIWHRYHSSNKTKGKKHIDLEEFQNLVAVIGATSYEGHQAATVFL